MLFLVNGVDIAPYIKQGGLTRTRNDLDSEKSKRTMDGTMHRSRITIKIKLEIECRPLTSDEASILLNAIEPEFVQVQYTDPQYGDIVLTMYSNNIPATHMVSYGDGNDVWDGITFPLIEQ